MKVGGNVNVAQGNWNKKRGRQQQQSETHNPFGGPEGRMPARSDKFFEELYDR